MDIWRRLGVNHPERVTDMEADQLQSLAHRQSTDLERV
jgi:hypothetical protein